MRENVRRSCTICFTRSVPSRLRASSLSIASRALLARALVGAARASSTYSSSSCRFACTKPIGLLSSCATPATSWPSERIFSLCTSCACVSRSSSRALLDARLERLVELRDLVEGLGVLDRDRRSGSRACAGAGGRRRPSRSPESLRPTAITPSRSTPNRTGTSSSTSSVSKASRQSSRTSGSASSSKSLARELLAAHPELAAERMVERRARSAWRRRPIRRARRRRASCCSPSSSSITIARSTPIVSVTATRMRSTISCDREHRDHRLGDLADRARGSRRGRGRRSGRPGSARGSRSGLKIRIAKNRKTIEKPGVRASTSKRANSASAKLIVSAKRPVMRERDRAVGGRAPRGEPDVEELVPRDAEADRRREDGEPEERHVPRERRPEEVLAEHQPDHRQEADRAAERAARPRGRVPGSVRLRQRSPATSASDAAERPIERKKPTPGAEAGGEPEPRLEDDERGGDERERPAGSRGARGGARSSAARRGTPRRGRTRRRRSAACSPR